MGLSGGDETQWRSSANSIFWISRYGIVIASAYDIGSTDGVNDKGLVANILYLLEPDYSLWDARNPVVFILVWAQCVLYNFETLAKSVEYLKKSLSDHGARTVVFIDF